MRIVTVNAITLFQIDVVWADRQIAELMALKAEFVWVVLEHILVAGDVWMMTEGTVVSRYWAVLEPRVNE